MSRSLKTRLFQAAREAGFLTNDPSPMRDPDDPPIGWTDGDRDGAKFYMGCDFWTPAREGQAPAVVPPPTTASRQDPRVCDVCGSDVPPGMVCGGCMADPDRDGRLVAEIVRDEARSEAKARREAESKGPQDFASRKFRGKKVKDRTARS